MAALAFVGAFLLGLLTRSKPAGPNPVGRERDDAEADAQGRIEEIHREAAEREKEVVVRADTERRDASADVRADTEIVKDDLSKTNEYVRGVGDEMRKP